MILFPSGMTPRRVVDAALFWGKAAMNVISARTQRRERPFGGRRAAAWVCGGLLLLSGVGALAQARQEKDPLTDEQVEQVRESGDQPMERIKLYMKFIEQRTTEIHKSVSHPQPQNSAVQIHNLLQEFTRLSDELQDNLDTYTDEHDDLRKVLKDLVEHSTKWTATLNEPTPSQEYDFARKTSLDAAASTTELARKLLKEQEQYFATHKKPKQQ
jgi:hypothetical protein